MKKMILAAAIVACAATSANAAYTLPAVTVVPNSPATGAGGVTIPRQDASNGDILNFTVTGLAFLQGPALYGTNAAGVVVVPGSIGTGSSSIDPQSGFTYGALIAVLNGNRTVQVFPTSVANGLNSLTPPVSLTYVGTIQDLFGIPPRQQLASASITFRVDDSSYTDNSGGFLITNNAITATAVPEPATWAMMLMGFGMVGFGLRSRRSGKVTTKVAFA